MYRAPVTVHDAAHILRQQANRLNMRTNQLRAAYPEKISERELADNKQDALTTALALDLMTRRIEELETELAARSMVITPRYRDDHYSNVIGIQCVVSEALLRSGLIPDEAIRVACATSLRAVAEFIIKARVEAKKSPTRRAEERLREVAR